MLLFTICCVLTLLLIAGLSISDLVKIYKYWKEIRSPK